MVKHNAAFAILEHSTKKKNQKLQLLLHVTVALCVCLQDPGPIALLFMKQLLRVDCSLCALCWHR